MLIWLVVGLVVGLLPDRESSVLEYSDIFPNLLEQTRAYEWMTNLPGYIFGLSRGASKSAIGIGFAHSEGEFFTLVSDVYRAEWLMHNGVSRGYQQVQLESDKESPIGIEWSATGEDVIVRVSAVPQGVVAFLFIEHYKVNEGPSNQVLTITDDSSEVWKIQFRVPQVVDPSKIIGCGSLTNVWISPSLIASHLNKDTVTCPWQPITFIPFSSNSDNALVFRIGREEVEEIIDFPETESGLSNWHNRALSNLFGNLGRFYGPLSVSDPLHIVSLTPDSMRIRMTSIGPSRSKFPRPFLWDDGFHMLAIDSVNRPVAVEIVTSWLRLQLVSQQEGWIPRELALSDRDRAAIPPKFLSQDPLIANPLSLLFVIRIWLREEGFLSSGVKRKIQNHLNRWFHHLDKTLKSSSNGCYRWKPRDSNHCLASGLDDYPRGSAVNEDECHLDLHMWMMLLADTIGSKSVYAELESTMENILKVPDMSIFADFLGNGGDPTCPGTTLDLTCNQKEGLHSSHIGYVTLFPLMLGQLCPKTHKATIRLLTETVLSNQLLLSEFYGVMSLAKTDIFFGAGENYWRGNIWANMNLLIVGALHAYSEAYLGEDPQLAALLKTKAERIRLDWLNATKKAWDQAGSPREYIDPLSGEGGGATNFAGWTAAAVALLEDGDVSFWNRAIGIRENC